MGETIHHFKTIEDYKEYMENDYQEPFVSCINYDKTTIRYNKTEEERERLLGTPLTFEIQSDGDIIWKTNNTGITKTIEYSKNGGEWTSITSATGDTAPSISVVSGDTIQFRGNNTAYGKQLSSTYYNCFTGSTCSFSLKGNIMSLINSTDFANLTNLSGTYNFFGLFSDCTGLTDASELLLPATTLREACYYNMFWGCTSLITAPELPATTLATSCYSGMFRGCTSLTGVPVNYLPVTTLAIDCYKYMFVGCTGLTTAPELPATTLANYCYYYMFSGCTSLTQAPELPATTLASGCYSNMFRGCNNLNYIKCLATDISATYCTSDWVYNVASTGTFVKPASTDWSSKTGSSGIPSGWTVQDAS